MEELSSDEKKKIAADLGIDENEVMMIHSAIGTWAESQIVSERDGMSILVDFLGTTPDGERYKAVFKEEDAFDANGNRKENIILKRVENGRLIYELTDEQKIAAKKTLVRQLSSELTANTEIVAEQIFDEPSVAKEEKDRLDNERKERSEEYRNMMSQIYYGDATEVAASETYFRDLLGATEVKKQGNIILVKKYNEETKRMQTTPITMLGEDGKLMSFDMFAKSAITGLVGKADIDKAVVLGGGMQMGVVKSVTLDEAPELQEDGTFTRGKVKVTFESGREEILAGGLGDYKVGSERELTSITPDGKGAGTIVSESDSAYKNRYIDAVVNVPKLKTLTKSDTVEDLSPTDVVSHLSVLTGLGFEVKDAPIQPNRVLVTAADGTVYKFETNKDTLDEQIKGLITFINTNMLDAKYDAADKKSVIGPKKEGTEIEGTTAADNLLNE